MMHMFFSVWSRSKHKRLDLPTLAKYMDLEKIQGRLLTGSDVNEVDRWGRTASHYAVLNADAIMLQLLAAQKADLSISDRLGASPLSLLADPWRQTRSSIW